MLTPIFALKQRKKCLFSYFGRLQDRAHHVTFLKIESFTYHILDFVQTFRTAIFLKTSFYNYTKDNWKQGVSDRELWMLWTWSYLVSKKKLSLKLAVAVEQAKLFVRNFVFIVLANFRTKFL